MTPRGRALGALLGIEALLSGLEALLLILPLRATFPGLDQDPCLVSIYGLSLGLFWVAGLRLAWPLFTRRPALSEEQLYRLGLALPGRGLLLRLGLAALLPIGVPLLSPALTLTSLDDGLVLLSVTLCLPLGVGLVRWALWQRVIRGLLTRTDRLPPALTFQADTLRQRLAEAALLTAAGAVGFLALLVFLFLRLSLEEVLSVASILCWIVLALGLLWFFLVQPRQVTPLIQYLRQASQGGEPPEDMLLHTARLAYGLPFSLALTKLALFGLVGLFLLFQSLLVPDLSLAQAVILCLALVIVAVGSGVYEMIWSRVELRPLVSHLLNRRGAEPMQVRAASLRVKMLSNLCGIIVFTVALALFFTALHPLNLRRDHAAVLARERLEPSLPSLRALAPQQFAAALPPLERRTGLRLLHVPAAGPADPLLTPAQVHAIRRQTEGALERLDLDLHGLFIRLDPGRPERGSLVAFVRLDDRLVPEVDRVGLVLFFLLVLAASLGVVLLTSADLTRPLASLERRAAEMIRGALDREVRHDGEFDTSGRLSSAFEQMRRDLLHKLHTIEKLNEELEEKVRMRTAELVQANSELVQAIEALKETQEQLVRSEKLASVGQLVAGIAHEINNPINAVVNTLGPLGEIVAELSGRPGLSEADRQAAQQDIEAMLRVIRSGTERTQRIVQALRNYARSDGESLSEVDLAADIDESLALLQHNLKGVTIQRQIEATGGLYAFRGQLNQAVMNLLSNAAHALEGRDDPRLTVRTRDAGPLVEIEVEDNGPGIPEAIRPRIFDPFFTTKEVGKGTGLGLSITHGILERHGGQIDVDSRPGRTVFTLRLPRRPRAT